MNLLPEGIREKYHSYRKYGDRRSFHRRENFGQAFIDVCTALKEIAIGSNDVELVYPVHHYPNVKDLLLVAYFQESKILDY